MFHLISQGIVIITNRLFRSEINDINLGLLVEVWNKGVIWDRALGYHYLPLTSVAYDEVMIYKNNRIVYYN